MWDVVFLRQQIEHRNFTTVQHTQHPAHNTSKDIKKQKLTRLPIYSDYIQIRAPVYTSHTAGRYAAKRFRKAQCPIVERLTNSLMMNGRNSGKKVMAVRIVAHAFEIVRLIQSHHTTLFPASNMVFSRLLS